MHPTRIGTFLKYFEKLDSIPLYFRKPYHHEDFGFLAERQYRNGDKKEVAHDRQEVKTNFELIQIGQFDKRLEKVRAA